MFFDKKNILNIKNIPKISLIIIFAVIYFLALKIFFGRICAVQLLIGMPCPGCGASRAFIMLIRGNFSDSFRFYPMLIFWIAYIALQVYNHFRTSKTKITTIKMITRKIAKQSTVLIIAATWIVFVVRCAVSFGTEPLTTYESSLLNLIIGEFKTLF